MKEFDPQAQQSRCPLCGEDNQCAIAAGKPPESCWCQGVIIDSAALQAIPEAERGRSCLCPACGSIRGESIER